jgi:serine O-acetyltransferase
MRDVLVSAGDSEALRPIRLASQGTREVSVADGDADDRVGHASSESYQAVATLLRAALMECTPPKLTRAILAHPCFTHACNVAHEDLHAFVSKDPAQRGSWHATLAGSTSYKATLHYRLAHALLTINSLDTFSRQEWEAYASLICNRGKLLSGAEIHPRSEIGRRFILDHGWGVVIGETSVIGDDCYMLGGVTLGAAGIAGNSSVKRHPTLGDRVQIGAFARIFGNIHVGNDVFIGTHCCVTHSNASGSIVTLRSETQVVRDGAAPHAPDRTF